ncbi:hypothetical protein BJ165DRAFT_1528653 [Panaeolus papilionaceus]|nr:hypothetical protein BJ165DRAFT_1528653 [Panaeolus papilionaceus]
MTVPSQPTLNPLSTSQSQAQPQSQRPGPRLTLSSSAQGSSPPSSPPSSSSPTQSVSQSISSFCTSLSTTLASSTTRLSKFTLPSITGVTFSSPASPTSPVSPTPRFGVRFSIQVPPPSTPLTPFGVSPRYTDAPASPHSDSTLISPPYSSGPYPYPYGGPASPPYSPTSSQYNGYYNPHHQSAYADTWAKRLHVLSRYVAYSGRTYYILALLSISTLTLLYITAAMLLHLEADGQPGTGPGGLHVEGSFINPTQQQTQPPALDDAD